MRARLIAAWPLERYQLWVVYSDGTEGAVDLEDRLVAGSLTEVLRDMREFRRLLPDRDQNLLVWPAGITLDAEPFHREIRQRRRRKRIGFL